ncbi:MAG: acetoin utilization protein AcuC [Actinomycetota bacterium]|nr:acetoin utilization protein AcuC [Actinomycetota bacterium]
MSDRVGLVLAPEARTYNLGPEHPLRPERVLLTWRLIQAYGLDQLPNVITVSPAPADDATIELVHTHEFVGATRAAGHGEDGAWGRFGYGPGDNPIFDRMHEAAAVVVGASVGAAQAVWTGEVEHAFNAAGGLHHAMPGRASGFCVYDDPAVAIAWLLDHGATRIAYVDVDVHHGDGPQAIFYDDPRVLTVSIHQKAPWFFPGTGDRTETGGPDARGSAVNVPLVPGTDDDGWLAAFRADVIPVVDAFDPEVLVTQLGCDTHTSDPLAQLDLTMRAYREAARELHQLAHRAARGRWVATGGGGYQWATVVPRAWTTYFAEMAGALDDLPPELPREFVDEAGRLAGRQVPDRLDAP